MKVKNFVPSLIIIGIGIATLTFIGCDSKTASQINTENQESLSNPQIMGTTEDNRIVKCYPITGPDGYTHYVYVVGGNSVTVERRVQSGKTTRLHTITTIVEDVNTNK